MKAHRNAAIQKSHDFIAKINSEMEVIDNLLKQKQVAVESPKFFDEYDYKDEVLQLSADQAQEMDMWLEANLHKITER